MTSGKGYVEHSRNELKNIEKNLGEYLKSSATYPLEKLETTLLKVIANITYGKDMSSLFPTMTMVTQSKSILVKKLAYHYISVYASLNPELSLLTLNTLKKENVDPDPTIRALSLRAITTLSYEDFGPLITSSIKAALNDKDKYVRKTAIICAYQCGFREEMKPEYLKQVADKNFDVHLNSLRILNEIGHFDKGLTRSIALHLLKRLENADLPGCYFIITLLHKYKPKDSEELFKIMDLLDPYINVKSFSVIFATISLLIKYTFHFPEYSQDIIERVTDVLLLLLNCGHSRISHFSTLRVLFFLLTEATCQNEENKNFIKNQFKKNWKLFIILTTDTINTTKLKLKILTELVDTNNHEEITKELLSTVKNYINESKNKGIRKHLLKVLYKIVVKVPSALREVAIGFIFFLELEIPKLSAEVIGFIVKILKNNKKHEDVLIPIVSPYLLQFDTFEHKKNMLWFASRYFNKIEESHFLLEEIVGQLYNIYKKKADKQIKESDKVNVGELDKMLIYNSKKTSINIDLNEEITNYNKILIKIIKYKINVMRNVCYVLFDNPQKMRKMVGALLNLFMKSEFENLIVKKEAFKLFKLIKENKKEELLQHCESNKILLNENTEAANNEESDRMDNIKNVLGFVPLERFEEEIFEYESHESLFSNLKLENEEQPEYVQKEEDEEEEEMGEEESEGENYEECEILELGMETEEFQEKWEGFKEERSVIVSNLREEAKGEEEEIINFLKNLKINVVASGVIDNVEKFYGCFVIGVSRKNDNGEMESVGEDMVLFELLISGSTDTAKITVKLEKEGNSTNGLMTLGKVLSTDL